LVTLGGVSVTFSWPEWWSVEKSKIDFWETLRPFEKNFSVYFFLFSEIQYRKTKWDSGAFFPLPGLEL
jgi:hypothetical protein